MSLLKKLAPPFEWGNFYHPLLREEIKDDKDMENFNSIFIFVSHLPHQNGTNTFHKTIKKPMSVLMPLTGEKIPKPSTPFGRYVEYIRNKDFNAYRVTYISQAGNYIFIQIEVIKSFWWYLFKAEKKKNSVRWYAAHELAHIAYTYFLLPHRIVVNPTVPQLVGLISGDEILNIVFGFTEKDDYLLSLNGQVIDQNRTYPPEKPVG